MINQQHRHYTLDELRRHEIVRIRFALAARKDFYSKLTHDGYMSQEKADHEINFLQSILDAMLAVV